MGVLAAQAQQDKIVSDACASIPGSTRPPRIGIKFHDRNGFGKCLFTALVARRDFERENTGAVYQIVRALQEKLSQFYGYNDSDLISLASYLSKEKKLFPSVGPHDGAVIKCSSELRQQYCYDALKYLRDNRILAESVKLDSAAWETAFSIWGLTQSKNRRDPYFFKQCAERRIAAQAHPGQVRRRFQEYWKRSRRIVASVLGSYGLVASTYGVFGRTVNSRLDVATFTGLVLLGSGAAFLAARLLFGPTIDNADA